MKKSYEILIFMTRKGATERQSSGCLATQFRRTLSGDDRKLPRIPPAGATQVGDFWQPPEIGMIRQAGYGCGGESRRQRRANSRSRPKTTTGINANMR